MGISLGIQQGQDKDKTKQCDHNGLVFTGTQVLNDMKHDKLELYFCPQIYTMNIR